MQQYQGCINKDGVINSILHLTIYKFLHWIADVQYQNEKYLFTNIAVLKQKILELHGEVQHLLVKFTSHNVIKEYLFSSCL